MNTYRMPLPLARALAFSSEHVSESMRRMTDEPQKKTPTLPDHCSLRMSYMKVCEHCFEVWPSEVALHL